MLSLNYDQVLFCKTSTISVRTLRFERIALRNDLILTVYWLIKYSIFMGNKPIIVWPRQKYFWSSKSSSRYPVPMNSDRTWIRYKYRPDVYIITCNLFRDRRRIWPNELVRTNVFPSIVCHKSLPIPLCHRNASRRFPRV